MRTVLEILRIIIILGLLGSLGWAFIDNIYTTNEVNDRFTWLGAFGILFFLFVLYRNKLQFSGWYEGKGRNKLPKKVSIFLIIASLILIISPFVIGSLLK